MECNIGNSLGVKLSKMNHSALRTLILVDDPITNKGMKILGQINLPNLGFFKIIHSKITRDGLKTFQKIFYKLNKLGISYHDHIGYT